MLKAVEGKWYFDISEELPHLLHNGTEIRVELTIRPYSIGASYDESNGAQLMNSFWPEQWWSKDPLKNPPNKVIVQVEGRVDLGQVLVVDAVKFIIMN